MNYYDSDRPMSRILYVKILFPINEQLSASNKNVKKLCTMTAIVHTKVQHVHQILR